MDLIVHSIKSGAVSHCGAPQFAVGMVQNQQNHPVFDRQWELQLTSDVPLIYRPSGWTSR
jgi:hypothetical protein